MKPFLLLAALLLAGCSTIQAVQTAASATVTPKAVAAAAQAFDAAEATAATYAQLPPCPQATRVCADKAVLVKLKAAILAGRQNRDNLEAWIQANPSGGVGGAGLYATLQASVADITAISNAK